MGGTSSRRTDEPGEKLDVPSSTPRTVASEEVGDATSCTSWASFGRDSSQGISSLPRFPDGTSASWGAIQPTYRNSWEVAFGQENTRTSSRFSSNHPLDPVVEQSKDQLWGTGAEDDDATGKGNPIEQDLRELEEIWHRKLAGQQSASTDRPSRSFEPNTRDDSYDWESLRNPTSDKFQMERGRHEASLDSRSSVESRPRQSTGRPSNASAGANMAHRSSFFTPSRGSSVEQDRPPPPPRLPGSMEAASAPSSVSKIDEGGYGGVNISEADRPSEEQCPSIASRVRISMDAAGGEHAPWQGNVGIPERMSLQIRANPDHAPRPSDTSSSGTIEELPQNLLTSIPPPPPPYPPSRPPDNMVGMWSQPTENPQSKGPVPGPGPGMGLGPGPGPGPGQGQGMGPGKYHPDLGGVPLQSDVLQGLSNVDIKQGPESVASLPASEGGKSKAVRSSFAAERRSVDAGGKQSSIEMFQSVAEDGSVARINSGNLPNELRRRYHQLAVLPAEVPVPIALLARLWGSPDLHDAEAAAALMETKRILKIAVLEDDTSWALISPVHLTRLQQKFENTLPQMHSRLINLYRHGFHNLALVPDDNYFMQNIAHHLVEAERLEELAGILRDPIWLETKLRSYGPGAVVSDFRRYLVAWDDADIKLLLRAFQISASASLDHPNLYVLKEQMLARLMVAARGTTLGNWYETARAECRMAVPHRRARNMPVHLLPRSPTLEQAGGLQRLILKGHSEGVRKVMLAPNGMEVVTASSDGSIRLWDMEIGDCVLFMEEHEAAVTCIAITPDGQTLISGGEDCLAIVFDLPSGIWKHKLRGHTKRVNAVAVDSQGRRVVSSSQDMTTRIWSLNKGTCLHVLTDFVGGQGYTWENWAGHHTVAISPDCRLVATVDGEYRVRVWKMETGELADTLEGHTDWVVALAFAGDSGKVVTASHDKTVRVWNLWTGVCEQVFNGHRGRINNLRITPDGNRAVSVSDDSVAIVWNLQTLSQSCELQGHGAWINDAAITHNATKVITASGDELAVVWDAVSGEVLQVLKGHSGEINAVDLSYKGRFAITASEDGTARVWDLQAPAAVMAEHHQGKVTKAVSSPDGRYMVTIGEDNAALVWDVRQASCRHMLQGHQTGLNWAFIVAEGRHLVTASGDRRVCIWDLESGECIRTLPEHRGSRMKSFAVSKDGSKAVIVLFDSTVSVWDLESMACIGWLIRRGERDGVRVHSGGVNGVYMCCNGSRALTISKDATARLWEISTGECVMVLKGHEDVVTTAVVREDGGQCLTAGYDKTARLWDLTTGECTMVLDHPSQVDHVAVDPDWQRAVSIADRKTAWLWDIRKGRCLGVLEGHTDEIAGACFSQDSRFIATYSANSVVRVWTAHSGRLRAVYLGDSGFTTCQFSGPGKIDTLVTGDGNGVVHFLEFPAKDLASSKKR